MNNTNDNKRIRVKTNINESIIIQSESKIIRRRFYFILRIAISDLIRFMIKKV